MASPVRRWEIETDELRPGSKERPGASHFGGDHVSVSQIAVELEALAERIKRIRACGRNGDLEPFHIDRSQAAHDARSLGDWLRSGRRPADYVLHADRGRADERRTRYSQR